MHDDARQLAELNQELGHAENAADAARLGGIIASVLAFQRRDGTVVDRAAYLQNPRRGQRETRIETINIYRNRAVVTCVVTDAGVATHNIRLFAREQGQWRLLGWANEPA